MWDKLLRRVSVPLNRFVGPFIFRWTWGQYLNYRHKAWDQNHAAMDVREWLCWHVDQKTKHRTIRANADLTGNQKPGKEVEL